ncbi:MAG: hypothetical protein M1824_004519 [Vezdaea acicularis]|nr:MAG: hypothetical protein M1824_004519 [Vezdaea acicularis]
MRIKTLAVLLTIAVPTVLGVRGSQGKSGRMLKGRTFDTNGNDKGPDPDFWSISKDTPSATSSSGLVANIQDVSMTMYPSPAYSLISSPIPLDKVEQSSTEVRKSERVDTFLAPSSSKDDLSTSLSSLDDKLPTAQVLPPSTSSSVLVDKDKSISPLSFAVSGNDKTTSTITSDPVPSKDKTISTMVGTSIPDKDKTTSIANKDRTVSFSLGSSLLSPNTDMTASCTAVTFIPNPDKDKNVTTSSPSAASIQDPDKDSAVSVPEKDKTSSALSSTLVPDPNKDKDKTAVIAGVTSVPTLDKTETSTTPSATSAQDPDKDKDKTTSIADKDKIFPSTTSISALESDKDKTSGIPSATSVQDPDKDKDKTTSIADKDKTVQTASSTSSLNSNKDKSLPLYPTSQYNISAVIATSDQFSKLLASAFSDLMKNVTNGSLAFPTGPSRYNLSTSLSAELAPLASSLVEEYITLGVKHAPVTTAPITPPTPTSGSTPSLTIIDYYISSPTFETSLVPVWAPESLGGAYGGGWAGVPTTWVTPGSPSLSGPLKDYTPLPTFPPKISTIGPSLKSEFSTTSGTRGLQASATAQTRSSANESIFTVPSQPPALADRMSLNDAGALESRYTLLAAFLGLLVVLFALR